MILAGDSLERLIGEGRIAAGSRVDLARCGIGVAVRAGAPRPDIGSADALNRALLQAKSIAYSSSASGVYLKGLFRRLGLADALGDRIRQVEGEPVGAVVARGEAEIGFQQVSELLPVAGIDYVGPLPAEIQDDHSFRRRHRRTAPASPTRREPSSPTSRRRPPRRSFARAAWSPPEPRPRPSFDTHVGRVERQR